MNRGSKGNRQNYSHSYKYIPEQYLKVRTDSWQSSLNLTHTIQNNLFYDVKASYFNQGYYSGLNKDTSEYLAATETEYFEEYGNGFEFYKRSDPPQLLESRTANVDFKADAVWQMGSMNEVKFGASYKNTG